MKNQNKINKLPYPVEDADAVRKFYVDSGLKDLSIIKNNVDVDFNNEILITFNLLK